MKTKAASAVDVHRAAARARTVATIGNHSLGYAVLVAVSFTIAVQVTLSSMVVSQICAQPSTHIWALALLTGSFQSALSYADGGTSHTSLQSQESVKASVRRHLTGTGKLMILL